MVSNDHRFGWVFAAVLLAGAAAAQDAPSWRALQEAPKRPDVPPEVERPEYEFSVSRDQLQGFSMPEEYRPAAAGDELVVVRPRRPYPEPESGQPARLVYSDAPEPTPSVPVPVQSSDDRVPIVEAAPPVGLAFTQESNPVDGAGAPVPPAIDYRLTQRRMVEPDYPHRAHREEIEGWVYLKVTVDPSGTVTGVEVIDAEPTEVFDEAAVRAVRQWRYEPPRLAGVMTSTSRFYRIQFRLDED